MREVRWRHLLVLAVAALLAVLVLQNLTQVELNLLAWSIAAPRAVLYLALFGAGVLVGWLLARRRG